MRRRECEQPSLNLRYSVRLASRNAASGDAGGDIVSNAIGGVGKPNGPGDDTRWQIASSPRCRLFGCWWTSPSRHCDGIGRRDARYGMTPVRRAGEGASPVSHPASWGAGIARLRELSFWAAQHIISPPDPLGRGLCTRDDLREMGFRSGEGLIAFSTGAGERRFVITNRRPW